MEHDEYDEIQSDYDETWFHCKISYGYLHMMAGCSFCPPWCCNPYGYRFDYRGVRHRWSNMSRPKRHYYWGHAVRARPGSGKGKFNNSKRKTMRTHRQPGSRK